MLTSHYLAIAVIYLCRNIQTDFLTQLALVFDLFSATSNPTSYYFVYLEGMFLSYYIKYAFIFMLTSTTYRDSKLTLLCGMHLFYICEKFWTSTDQKNSCSLAIILKNIRSYVVWEAVNNFGYFCKVISMHECYNLGYLKLYINQEPYYSPFKDLRKA